MFDKNDPLIASVKKVMEQNAKERAATEAVNEHFGITSRKALPHERQGEWEAAYNRVLSEGVETLNEDWDSRKRDDAEEIQKRAKKLRRGRHGPVIDQADWIAKKKKVDAVTGGDTAAGAEKAMQQLYGKNKRWKNAVKAVTVGEDVDEKPLEEDKDMSNSAHVGNRHRIDHDKDGKIEGSDLKALRMKKIMSFRKKK